MFGRSQKKWAAEALRRGALAALSGGYFHHTHAEEFGLNEEATSYLYTDAMAHQVYALGFVASKALAKYSWFGPDFFFDSVGKGIAEAERKENMAPGTVMSFCFKRYLEFESMPQEQAEHGGRWSDTAKRVKERDARADDTAIRDALENSTMAYFSDVAKMFTA